VALNLKNDELRLASSIKSDSIVDGEGLRAVMWCQGCRHACPGCHNPESWDERGGTIVKIDRVKNELRAMKGQAGLTFSGGEPMLQARVCKEISDWAKRELGWNIWAFTGFTYEDIRAQTNGATHEMWEFVKSLDVLIDGPFISAERDLGLKFRGSRNQHLLRLDSGEITVVE
jgi:anaerobic ribonucleoside-triphosphate reductase activating protein